jgi:HD-GYP domain-containing protein (c-di-GMP phosphodiesterase class II)
MFVGEITQSFAAMANLETVQQVLESPSRPAPPAAQRDPGRVLQVIEEIHYIKDLDTLLEKVLLEARRFVDAEAGTIYLAKGSRLYFRYVHNDALFGGERARDKYRYASQSLPIDKNSVAGYVAMTREGLLIDDVYDIPSDVSYSFNPDFDRKSSYRTRSILALPLVTAEGVTLGVLQLINARGPGGTIVPFSMQDRLYVTEFARNAANAIEKAKLTQMLVMRMVEMALLRDPYETTQHARRVGASSVELWKHWARAHGVEEHKIRKNTDVLHNAAILHDVGKVALSDVILRKPGGLRSEEVEQMRSHTIHGARLFRHRHTSEQPMFRWEELSAWDRVGYEVALNHHERWDGTGYPGKFGDLFSEHIHFGPGKKGKEIPLSARIVALADVYDALISKRAYKEAWTEEQALRYIRQQADRHFDPELVRIFLSIYDVIRAIGHRFP